MRLSITVEEKKKPTSLSHKIKQAAKLSIPYVGLLTALLLYICSGALIFMSIEGDQEELQIKDEFRHIESLENEIGDMTWIMKDDLNLDYEKYSEMMTIWLKNLSSRYNTIRRPHVATGLNEPATKLPRWTFRSAVLYSLTIISSTGYGHLTPITDTGKVITVIYGLIGIPLMFITAANIGKLLSESIMMAMWFIQNKVCKSHPNYFCVKRRPKSYGQPTTDDFEVPLTFIFCLIAVFCGIGAVIYHLYTPQWNMIESYVNAFLAFISVSLSDMGFFQVDYVIFLMAYKILSLAVLTMCLDLARFKILKMFTRVHYFGRKIKDIRFYTDDDEYQGVDIFLDPRFKFLTEEIIEAIRKEYPEKLEITATDILDYLRNLGHSNARLREEYNQAFVPEGFRFFKFADAPPNQKEVCEEVSFGMMDSSSGDTVANSIATITESELTPSLADPDGAKKLVKNAQHIL